MDQTIPGLTQTGGPTFLSDLLLFVFILAGYYFIAFKAYLIPKLNPAPKKDTSNMTFWQRVRLFGAISRHELTEAEWASIRKCRKLALPIIAAYTILVGFLSSSFGLVWMMWAWLATLGGMAVRIWSDRRIERAKDKA